MKSHLKHDSFLKIRDIMHFKTMKWIRKKLFNQSGCI